MSVNQWLYEEAQPFVGWDFSYLAGRMVEDQPPWSYRARAGALMRQSGAVLDMETGGGERLLAMRAAWPDRVIVTEGYPPNVALAQARLGPLGVRVIHGSLASDGALPLADGAVDLVLNRHATLVCDEIARVLAPGGTFLTQQIHGLWAQDLLAFFDVEPQWAHDTPAYYVPRLERAGFEIIQHRDWQGDLIFKDVGALVYYLRAVPWLVPGFSVTTHTAYLLRLQAEIEEKGRLVYEARKFLIEARKPPV
jgi:SAM-dependent methyltransferase